MILQVEGVTKEFGGLAAVRDVSFNQRQEEIVGLIGPNGAGKTTLFNCINGVFPVTRGAVVFRGRPLGGLAVSAVAGLGIARAHQIVRPLAELSVRENVMVGACYGRERMELARAATTADTVLEQLGLAPQADAPAGRLNLAQKKRLELARALAARPHLLLLDEVLAGLNPTEVSGMVDALRAVRGQGVTILMIEHIMRAVMSLSDRVVVLNHGEKIAEGTPTEVTSHPQVVEAYLGDPAQAERLLAEDGG